MKLRSWTKFFGLLTIAFVAVYFIGNWYVESNPGVVWLVPDLWVIAGAVISAILFGICYVRKR